jgi:hypothetical protein
LASEQGHLHVIEFLCKLDPKFGFNINAKADRNEKTALHLAVAKGHLPVVKFLLEKLDDSIINSTTTINRFEDATALDFAIKNSYQNIIIEILQSPKCKQVHFNWDSLFNHTAKIRELLKNPVIATYWISWISYDYSVIYPSKKSSKLEALDKILINLFNSIDNKLLDALLKLSDIKSNLKLKYLAAIKEIQTPAELKNIFSKITGNRGLLKHKKGFWSLGGSKGSTNSWCVLVSALKEKALIIAKLDDNLEENEKIYKMIFNLKDKRFGSMEERYLEKFNEILESKKSSIFNHNP